MFEKHVPLYDCENCLFREISCRHLNPEEFEVIRRMSTQLRFNRGETIFKQGTSFTHTVCILEGLVKVYLETRKRKNFILSLIGPGEMLGSPGMFTDNMHHFSVVAVEDTLACHVERQAIEEVYKLNSIFAIEMQKKSNLRDIRHYRKFRTLAQKQMPGRVAEAILYLSNSIYKSNPFTLTITRQDIADLASITKEGTIRVMKDFKDAGLISIQGNEVKILNEKALSNISENG